MQIRTDDSGNLLLYHDGSFYADSKFEIPHMNPIIADSTNTFPEIFTKPLDNKTLRDEFAMVAVQGLLATGRYGDDGEDYAPSECAEDAYCIADAMIRFRGTSNV